MVSADLVKEPNIAGEKTQKIKESTWDFMAFDNSNRGIQYSTWTYRTVELGCKYCVDAIHDKDDQKGVGERQ